MVPKANSSADASATVRRLKARKVYGHQGGQRAENDHREQDARHLRCRGRQAPANEPGKGQFDQRGGQQQAQRRDEQGDQHRAGGQGRGGFPGFFARAALEEAGEDRHEDAAHGVGADQAAQEAGDGQGGGKHVDHAAGPENGGGDDGAAEVGQAGGQRRPRVSLGAGQDPGRSAQRFSPCSF